MDILRCSFLAAAGAALLGKSFSISHEFLSRMVVLLAVQYIALKLFYVLIWPFYFSSLRYLPTAKVRPFFSLYLNRLTFLEQGGNLLLGQSLNQARADPSEIEKSWMREHPDAPFVRYLSIFNQEWLMVNNVRALKEVLQTKCYSFVKPGYYERVVAEIAGRGILFMEGEEHRKSRKVLGGRSKKLLAHVQDQF
jgi:hypothetical protein